MGWTINGGRSVTRRRAPLLALVSAALLLAVPAAGRATAATAPTRPNILLIVADDLGWSDLGAWGGEAATPALDALAQRGLRLTNFHTAPTCSPTRTMLLTGVDHHRAGLGAMTETLAFSPTYRDRPGYEGHLNERVVTVAELLREAGYATLMTGKWHIGYAAADLPPARGFDHSFALLQGGAGHFDGSPILPSDPASSFRADGAEASWPAGRYSTDVFTDLMLGYLQELPREQPVFAYVAYTAPHWPLQAPDELIRKYQERYSGGPAALRAERLARLQELGLLGSEPAAADPAPSAAAWAALPEAERARQARVMAVYAAMIDRLDANVGRLLDGFRRSGRLDNTVVVFLSDNGAEAMEAATTPMPGMQQWLAAFDNSLANTGRPGSYVTQGRFWAPVSNLPFRGAKGGTYEGGIRTVAFIALPSGATGRIDDYTHVLDLAPTVLELAGVPRPGGNYRGRNVWPMEGHLLPLPGLRPAPATDPRVASFELFGNRSTQAGSLKIVSPWRGPAGSAPWQLFDLASDPGERHDLASDRPADLARLVGLHQEWLRDYAVVMPAANMPGYASQ